MIEPNNLKPECTLYSPGVYRVHSAFFAIALFLCSCEKSDAEPAISRIALGSCAHQEKSQPIWEPIVAAKPELFLFLGDNIYGDTEKLDVLRAKYKKLGAKPGYIKLKATCPIYAVWDDHDYGLNDSGKEHVMKVDSEKAFHEFFGTPEHSEVLKYPGTYQVKYFGEAGKRLQVILLDTRYFRDELKKLPIRAPEGPYARNLNPQSTLLGDAQWKWLEKQLQAPADFRIIASSIQFLPQDHRWERWENLPLERQRFLKLLKTHVKNPVLFVSGDRHMGEIMKLKTSDPLSPGYPVYELTSSGLTNAGGGKRGETNRHRVSATNFQKRNFGMIEIDWEDSSAVLSLRDVEGTVVDRYPISF